MGRNEEDPPFGGVYNIIDMKKGKFGKYLMSGIQLAIGISVTVTVVILILLLLVTFIASKI